MEDLVGSEEEAEVDLISSELNSCHIPAQVASIPLTDCPFSDAIFKELSIINGQINAMKRKELVVKLKKYHLNHKGDIMVLRKRLKNHFKVTKLTKAKLMEKHNLQPFYVVIDFEATCQENNPVDFKYEIIEFPAILVHTESLKIVDVFHSYVRPVINPKLTAFCQQLTGITQEEVDKAAPFPKVLKKFESWLSSHGLLSSRKFIVTDGPWDMGRFLFLQCKQSKLPYPSYAREWTNLRKIFRNFYKFHQGGTLEDMVKFVGLQFEGRPHKGLDDSYNIARMFIHLLKDGALIRVNERITNHCRSHNNMHVIPVPYKNHLNTLDEVTSLRSELVELNLSLNASDTEPSDDESQATREPPGETILIEPPAETILIEPASETRVMGLSSETITNETDSIKSNSVLNFRGNNEISRRITEILNVDDTKTLRSNKKSKPRIDGVEAS